MKGEKENSSAVAVGIGEEPSPLKEEDQKEEDGGEEMPSSTTETEEFVKCPIVEGQLGPYRRCQVFFG